MGLKFTKYVQYFTKPKKSNVISGKLENPIRVYKPASYALTSSYRLSASYTSNSSYWTTASCMPNANLSASYSVSASYIGTNGSSSCIYENQPSSSMDSIFKISKEEEVKEQFVYIRKNIFSRFIDRIKQLLTNIGK